MKATEVAEHTAKNCESLDHCIAGFGLLSLYSSLGLWDAIPSKTLASTLLSALGKHTEDLSLCRSGCAVVRHLAERPEALALVATPEAVRVLSALLGAHFQHEDAAAALCLALYELVSAVEALQGVLLSCGGVGALLRALAAHPGNDGICKAACDVLVYLSTAPGVAGALAACVPGVAEALRALAGDAATCGCLCELLCHVTEGLYEKIPGEKELVNALLGVVRTHEADPVVTGLACQVLGHVVELSEDGRQLVWGLVENDPLLSKFIGSIF